MNGTIPKTVIFRVIIIGESNFCEVFVELFSVFLKSVLKVFAKQTPPLSGLESFIRRSFKNSKYLSINLSVIRTVPQTSNW